MNSEKMFIEVPTETEVKQEIQSIIKKGLINEEKSNFRRNVLATAAAIFVSLFALGLVFPGYASQIPLIGGIFELFETDHRDYSPLQDVALDVSDEVGITQLPEDNIRTYILEDGTIKIVNETDGSVTIMDVVDEAGRSVITDGVIPNVINETDGMSLTIKEVVFDGQTVYFTYHVETDRALGDDHWFELSRPELWVDGVDLMEYQGFGASPGVLQRISEHNYIAIGSFNLPVFDENVEYADFNFTIGNWQVGFPIVKIDTEVIEVNETVSNESFEVTILQVLVSEIGGMVFYDYILPLKYDWLGWDFFTSSPVPEGVQAEFGLRVIDDLGNELDGEMSSTGIGDEEGLWVRGTLTLSEPLNQEATELIITPFMYVSHWYLGDWRHDGVGSVGEEEVIANGGSVETREVILGEIVVPLP